MRAVEWKQRCIVFKSAVKDNDFPHPTWDTRQSAGGDSSSSENASPAWIISSGTSFLPQSSSSSCSGVPFTAILRIEDQEGTKQSVHMIFSLEICPPINLGQSGSHMISGENPCDNQSRYKDSYLTLYLNL